MKKGVPSLNNINVPSFLSGKIPKEEKTEIRIVLPKNSTEEERASVYKAIAFMRSTVVRQLVAYEMAFPEFSSLSSSEREKECEMGIDCFRNLLLSSPLVQENQQQQQQERTFFHFCIDYPTYVQICKEENLVLLQKAMLNGGGVVSEQLYHILTDNAFRDHIPKQQPVGADIYFVGSAEIALTLQGDVKRVCFLGVKTPARLGKEERSALVEFLKPNFPDAERFLNDDIESFLLNPEANGTFLKEAMEMLSMEDRAVASAPTQNACAYCYKAGPRKTCSRCPQIKYCGEACQKAHWGKHKSVCK